MNAPVAAHGITNAAINGEIVLRALAARPTDDPFASLSDLAKAIDRAPKNMGREIGQLEGAKLLNEDAPLSVAALTDAGHEALARLDMAAGATGNGLLFVLPALLDDNPLNPRKVYDAEKLEGLADTIEADGQVIEPLIVSPPQANGRRMIWAGHRRQRAAMIVEARFATRGHPLPAGLAQGVPCIERAADPAEALFIAVVENSQRENLPPWEDAQSLAALAEATGWSGRELARRTGRAPRLDEGDEEGVRDVQEKIRTAREAPAELVQAHEAGLITWEQLRGAVRNGRMSAPAPSADPGTQTVQGKDVHDPRATDDQPELLETPPLELKPREIVALMELHHAAQTSPDRLTGGDEAAPIHYAPVGKYWLDMVANALQSHRLIDFKHHGRPYARVTPKGLEWMEAHYPVGLAQPGEGLVDAYIKLDYPPDADRTGYITDWLNPPAAESTAPAEAQTATDDAGEDPDEAARADAATALSAARTFASLAGSLPSDPDVAEAWGGMLKAVGVKDGFSVDPDHPGCVWSGGEPFCVSDTDGQLPDDLATARALVIAAALNRLAGFQMGTV